MIYSKTAFLNQKRSQKSELNPTRSSITCFLTILLTLTFSASMGCSSTPSNSEDTDQAKQEVSQGPTQEEMEAFNRLEEEIAAESKSTLKADLASLKAEISETKQALQKNRSLLADMVELNQSSIEIAKIKNRIVEIENELAELNDEMVLTEIEAELE